MFSSLLAAVVLSGTFSPSAQAGALSGLVGEDGSGAHIFSLGAGRVENAAADRRGGGSKGGGQGNGQSRPSGTRSRPSSGGGNGGGGNGGGDSRGEPSRSGPDRSDGPSKSDGGSRSDGPERSDSPSDRGPEADRHESPDRGPDADRGQPPSGQPGAERSPTMSRPLEGARPAPGRPDGVHPVDSRVPSNYRGNPHPGSPNANAPGPLRQQQAQAVRRSHATSSHPPHRDARGHVYASHGPSDNWRNDYWSHHHGPAPRYHWSRPGTWFVSWHPGRPHYWYHGVFVYGPPPTYHGSNTSKAAAPERKVNHAGDWSVGLRGGSYLSGYDNGTAFGDFGLGVAARYRVVEPLGFEVQWTYHDDTWSTGTERIDSPLSASVELFAFPWSKVNPYVLAGVTSTGRNIQDEIAPNRVVNSDQAFWGPHLGLGVEIGLSKKTTLNFDARFMGYLNHEIDDHAAGGATQLNTGVNFYF